MGHVNIDTFISRGALDSSSDWQGQWRFVDGGGSGDEREQEGVEMSESRRACVRFTSRGGLTPEEAARAMGGCLLAEVWVGLGWMV